MSSGSVRRRSTNSWSWAAQPSPSPHMECGMATVPSALTSSTPTLSCMDTSSSTASSPTPKRCLKCSTGAGSLSLGGRVALIQTILCGPASIACTMYPVREVGAIASPPPWSAPMVGSSMTSTVLRGSICLESHAHDATSVTNILGARMTCTRLLRTLPVPSPPEVSWIFSTPRRSFSSICARLLEVEAPRRPQSQEQVTELLCTHAKGMPML
mmetsp:Transcript_27624/g.65275  ORF Transcript_27624/g.65275 Transcript_27624/m.65275 type:complete len:213 (-) Transcript_27624:1182-1820(-)